MFRLAVNVKTWNHDNFAFPKNLQNVTIKPFIFELYLSAKPPIEMEEICEKIPSQKGKDKINARGYLMVKDKNRKESYYWCCEFRKF